MKLGYFGYCFAHTQRNQRWLFDLRPFLNGFCSYSNLEFKNGIYYGGENVYLLPRGRDFFIFLITRSQEIVRKINSSNLSVEEINDLLEAEEQISFASYVLVQQNWLAFASTMHAPRIKTFSVFVNELLEKCEKRSIRFIAEPLLHTMSREEALNLPFIGQATLRVAKENSLGDMLLRQFGGDPEDYQHLDSFELTLKPMRRKDIREAVQKVSQSASSDGLQIFRIRAKDEIGGALQDVWIEGKGQIADWIGSRSEPDIREEINEKATANVLLREKINEFSTNDDYSEATLTLLMLLATLAIGPATSLIYDAAVPIEKRLALYSSKSEIAQLVAALSFTMLGFLATAITLLFALSDRPLFAKYQQRGHLDVLLFVHLAAVMILAASTGLAFTNFSSASTPMAFRCMLMLFVDGVAAVLLLMAMIANLARNSH